MPALQFATGPVTWGVDFADAPTNPPWELVLDEIAQSDVSALELGPVGYLPEDARTLRAELARRDLRAVGSFVFEDFHDAAQSDAIADVTRRACRAIAAAGGTILVLIDRPCTERAATAGRSGAARRLDRAGWSSLMAALRRAAAIAADHGLRPVVHPHAGSYVEFEDEIERLLDESDLGLCLDTGHAAYAGLAAEHAVTAYADRLGHVHLKDVRADVLARIHEDGLDFWSAIAESVFCPLGRGRVDVPAVLSALDAAGYAGFATIEQDRVAGRGSPPDDLRESLRVLGEARRAAMASRGAAP